MRDEYLSLEAEMGWRVARDALTAGEAREKVLQRLKDAGYHNRQELLRLAAARLTPRDEMRV